MVEAALNASSGVAVTGIGTGRVWLAVQDTPSNVHPPIMSVAVLPFSSSRTLADARAWQAVAFLIGVSVVALTTLVVVTALKQRDSASSAQAVSGFPGDAPSGLGANNFVHEKEVAAFAHPSPGVAEIRKALGHVRDFVRLCLGRSNDAGTPGRGLDPLTVMPRLWDAAQRITHAPEPTPNAPFALRRLQLLNIARRCVCKLMLDALRAYA